MLDMVLWMLGLGWPRRISSSGGILVLRSSRANITDTQSATFEFPELNVVWLHRTWGAPVDPQYPWGATFYGENATLKVSVNHDDFIPSKGQPIHRDRLLELDKFPGGPHRARPGSPRRPRGAPAHAGLPARHRLARPPGRGHRRRAHL